MISTTFENLSNFGLYYFYVKIENFDC
jgi:hypothetical protein